MRAATSSRATAATRRGSRRKGRGVDGEQVRTGSSSVWRNRDFVLLWSGQLVSSIGSRASEIAFPLLMLALTHSAAQAGILSLLRGAPYAILGLFAGVYVDRWDRKLVMISCEFGRAVALGSIPVAFFLGHLSLVQLYFAALVEGSLYVFFDVADLASLRNVVTLEQLPHAIGHRGAIYSISDLLGMPVGGLLFQFGRTIPFAADAVSYLVSGTSLLFIKARFQSERTTERRAVRDEIGEGLAWIWRRPLIRFMVFVSSGTSMVDGAMYLIVIVVAHQQRVPPAAIGLIFAIGSVGGFLASTFAGKLQQRLGFTKAILTCRWFLAGVWLLYLVAATPVALGLVTAAVYAGLISYNVVWASYRAVLTPDALRGRISSASRLLTFGPKPVVVAVTGALLQWTGAMATVEIFGALLVVLAVAVTVNREVRQAPPITALEPA